MSRDRRPARQATLFELGDDDVVAVEEAPLELPLSLAAEEEQGGEREDEREPGGEEGPAAAPAATAAGEPAAPVRARVVAGLLDLGFHLLVAGGALLGASLLGAPPRPAQLPGFVALVLVVSLFYTVVPLAFWGRTPGMAAVGIACRSDDGQPIAFADAGRRWLGGLLSVLLLGLPALLLLADGRSLADRLSGRTPARG